MQANFRNQAKVYEAQQQKLEEEKKRAIAKVHSPRLLSVLAGSKPLTQARDLPPFLCTSQCWRHSRKRRHQGSQTFKGLGFRVYLLGFRLGV